MLGVNLEQGFQLPLPVVFLLAPVCVERIYTTWTKEPEQLPNRGRWPWNFMHLIRHRDSARNKLLLYYAKIVLRKEHFRDKNHSLFKYHKSAEQEIESSSLDQVFLTCDLQIPNCQLALMGVWGQNYFPSNSQKIFLFPLLTFLVTMHE